MGKWSDFTSEVEAGSNNRAPGCSVGAYLKTLTGEGLDAVEAALARPELTSAAIARAIQNRGMNLSEFTVRRHRKGVCSCPKNG